MNKNCKQCGEKFTVYDKDLELYDKNSPILDGQKYALPAPTICPDCRQQRRLMFRNERVFYYRKCDLSGKQIISIDAPDAPYPVYGYDEWWSDKWDAKKYGRDFDFNRPFFEQFNELSLEVPRPCVVTMNGENSIYTNHSAYNKNCYMCINTGYSEDLLYCSNYNLYNKNCVDCLAIQKCELCYSCVNTKNSFSCFYLYECESCSDSKFLYDCQSCQHCFGCWNLRHKKYCIFNEQYSEKDYHEKLKELDPKNWAQYQETFGNFRAMLAKKAIHRDVLAENNFESSGDHIVNSKNVHNSYYVFGSEDCAYCYDAGEMKDCIDIVEPFKGELQYETHGCNSGYNLTVCSKCYEDNHLIYCQYCWSSSNLFGCFGMKNEKYCILNKQYTKEEYEALVPKIIEHMKSTGEWGEFFSVALTPFAYNETTANDYYPLSKEEVLKMGWKWKDDDSEKMYKGPVYKIPENVADVQDDICKNILTCEITGKLYKIIPQELDFYRKMQLPIPQRCPDQRHKERMALRNPRKLWDRACVKCGTEIHTSYSPDRPEKVYCEKCYLTEVY